MKKIFKGKVISLKQANTAVVNVVRKVQHPMYKKLLTVNKNFNVDTTGFTPAIGDTVKIEETRPLSKTKNFKILK